ncbi:MAG TPA: competence protein ComA [Ruminococcaceae bacterium]|jgi:type IV pilus assembly protein PilM|nr:competence protein ComA [Oscillospiraceae bacterium]
MLSIDITDRQIKLVRGLHSGSKIRVQDADMRELTLGMVSNGYITDVPMVAAELNDIIKTKGITEKDAIVSITSSSIVYKEMMLPKPKSIKNTAAIEAMIQTNMGVSNEFNISYTIAGETEDEEKNKLIKIIATACPQRLVDGYVRLFSHIGLSLKAVNISNNSVTRLIVNTPKMAERMPMLLIQIDKGFLNMNLYEDNQIVFSRYFNIDPTDYDNAPDYVVRAVYDNLFRMIQFIKSRKGAKPLKEIMFYGDTGNFIELSNAISSFNVPVHVLAAPSTVVTMTEIDFTKYANAIGAIYRRNKDLEHINLLEATSAKESKGMNGYLIMLGGACVAAVVLVAAINIGLSVVDKSIQGQVRDIDTQIQSQALQQQLSVVSEREGMLSGFNTYNQNAGSTSTLFNYMPKFQSYVIDKIKEPMEAVKSENGIDLDIQAISIEGTSVSVKFMGQCKGDPTSMPAAYVNKLTNEVKTKYGDPYFQNIVYTGFEKTNSNNASRYLELQTGECKYDTIFTFEISMNLRPGSDEEHANSINLDLDDNEGVTEASGEEVTE